MIGRHTPPDKAKGGGPALDHIHAGDDRLDDRSERGVRAIVDEEKVLLAEVRALGAGLAASSVDAIDLAILAGALEADVLVREKLAPQRRMC
jgi:hypothetical protein